MNTLPDGFPFLRHIGIYAYRAAFLQTFSTLKPTPLERTEMLEQLRALEHGYTIAVSIAPEAFPAGVDTQEDLTRVRAVVEART
jgi:3-deoxy-manno-octulosonate cytidylyltransferase (CMP-KDO synthetase)